MRSVVIVVRNPAQKIYNWVYLRKIWIVLRTVFGLDQGSFVRVVGQDGNRLRSLWECSEVLALAIAHIYLFVKGLIDGILAGGSLGVRIHDRNRLQYSLARYCSVIVFLYPISFLFASIVFTPQVPLIRGKRCRRSRIYAAIVQRRIWIILVVPPSPTRLCPWLHVHFRRSRLFSSNDFVMLWMRSTSNCSGIIVWEQLFPTWEPVHSLGEAVAKVGRVGWSSSRATIDRSYSWVLFGG